MKKFTLPVMVLLMSVISFYCSDYVPYNAKYGEEAAELEQAMVVCNESSEHLGLIFTTRYSRYFFEIEAGKCTTLTSTKVDFVDVDLIWGNVRLSRNVTRFNTGLFGGGRCKGYVTYDNQFDSNQLDLLKSAGVKDSIIDGVRKFTYNRKNIRYVKAVHLSDQ